MAYVPAFEHDVFLSYAHDDNRMGWVNDLHKLLSWRIDFYLGSRGALSVWLDKQKVGGNDLFNDSIPSACKNCAVLVCVVSPSYLGSVWCTSERTTFVKRLTDRPAGMANQHALPVFKLMLLEIPEGEQPEPLKSLIGFPFYEAEPANPAWTRQFMPQDKSNLDQRFVNATDRLAERIAKTLKQMASPQPPVAAAMPAGNPGTNVPGSLPGPPLSAQPAPVAQPVATSQPAPVQLAAPPGPAVYLAETTDDVDDDRDLVAQELRQFEITVLPQESPLPSDFEQMKTRVSESLAQCAVSVHILGSYYGKKLAGDPAPQRRSLAQMQFELATQAGLPRIVWLSGAIDDESLPPDQRQFLQAVKLEQGSGTGLEFLRCDLQELKAFVRNRVPKRPTTIEEAEEAGPVVFVSAHKDDIDRPEVKSILDLCAQRGCTVFASDRRAEREDSFIKQANGLVILYGGADRNWVTDQVFKVDHAARRRKRNPLVAAVLDGPPPPDEKPDLLFRSPTVMMVNARRGFDAKFLEPFLHNLCVRRAR